METDIIGAVIVSIVSLSKHRPVLKHAKLIKFITLKSYLFFVSFPKHYPSVCRKNYEIMKQLFWMCSPASTASNDCYHHLTAPDQQFCLMVWHCCRRLQRFQLELLELVLVQLSRFVQLVEVLLAMECYGRIGRNRAEQTKVCKSQ